MAHASPAPKLDNITELPETPITLSARGEKTIRFAATIAVLAVFVAALVLSWTGLTHLAVQAGFNESYAWLMPIAIDGLVLAGGLNVLHASLTRQSTKFGWFLTIMGAAISIWGNMTAYGGVGMTTEAIVHGIAPASMALALEALLRILRGRIHATQAELERQQQLKAKRQEEEEKRLAAEERRVRREEQAAARRKQEEDRKRATSAKSAPAASSAATATSPSPEPVRVEPVPVQRKEEASSPASSPSPTQPEKVEAQKDVQQLESSAQAPQPKPESKPEPPVAEKPAPANSAELWEADLDPESTLSEMLRIVESLPADTTDTDKVLAIIEFFPKPSSADLALVLGKGESADDKKSAYKALERARNKQKKLAAAAAKSSS